MTDSIGSMAGCLLIIAICAWAVAFLVAQLRSTIKTRIATDRTLSEVGKDDAPGMFYLQIVGLLLLIGAAASIGLWMIVVLVQGLVVLSS